MLTDNTLGVDDVMAILLALSASPEELEVVMISATYGNVPLQRYVYEYGQTSLDPQASVQSLTL